MDCSEQTTAVTHSVNFSGELLHRGFWLYVWEISTSNETLYYVGRTGDSSSPNAQSPFNRMSQHLGFNERCNVLRRRLTTRGIDPETCTFRLVAHGPILNEAAGSEDHKRPRDITAALEKALAVALSHAGYTVINKVHWRTPLDDKLFANVRSAFAAEFPKLTVEVEKP
jgi:hypothetical protein